MSTALKRSVGARDEARDGAVWTDGHALDGTNPGICTDGRHDLWARSTWQDHLTAGLIAGAPRDDLAVLDEQGRATGHHLLATEARGVEPTSLAAADLEERGLRLVVPWLPLLTATGTPTPVLPAVEGGRAVAPGARIPAGLDVDRPAPAAVARAVVAVPAPVDRQAAGDHAALAQKGGADKQDEGDDDAQEVSGVALHDGSNLSPLVERRRDGAEHVVDGASVLR